MTEVRINTAEGGAAPSILAIRGLQKSFGTLSVLRDISLSVERGNVLSIIGPSGSGKSTLLRCASFLEFADGGTSCTTDSTRSGTGSTPPRRS